VDDAAPDLSTRRARCAYYGKQPYKNECNYGGKHGELCRCEQPSNGPLPFFKYLGPGSPKSREMCRCGYYAIAHLPLWQATLNVDREWYKVGRKIHASSHKEHAVDVREAAQKMERRADDFRAMTRDTYLGKDCHVYGVEVVDLHQVPNPLKCKTFTPVGPAEFDEFYCGCHGWD